MSRRLHIDVIHNTVFIAFIIIEARLRYNGQHTYYKLLAMFHAQVLACNSRVLLWNGDCPCLMISCGSWVLFIFLALINSRISNADDLVLSSDSLPPFFLVFLHPPELQGGQQIEQVGALF